MKTKNSAFTASKETLEEILQSIKQVDGFGSVEVYIQDFTVTQITVRNIKKTNTKLSGNGQHRKKAIDKPFHLY